jgi:hypothetical protein
MTHPTDPPNYAPKTRGNPFRPGNPGKSKGPAVNTAANQRGKPFQPGRSGNPAGKPSGARHRVTVLAEKLMQGDCEAIVRAVIDAAKSGDMTAARIVLDRIAPARKGSPVSLTLPSVRNASDVADAMNVLLGEMADGEITPDEASIIAGILDARRRSIETVEHEARLSELEAKVK